MVVVSLAAAGALLVAIGWGTYSAYIDSQRPTIEIKKDDWECVKSEQRPYSQPMLIGKAIIIMPMLITVCVEYRRHAG
mgnify:CR=1 FL=1